MKHLFFILLMAAGSPATAQTKIKADTATSRVEEIGTTPYGLPVHKSYVAPDVAERAKKKYGRLLYSIEKAAANDCEQSYLVGLIRNGKLTMEWMCDDPKLVLQRQNDGLTARLW